VTPSLYYPTARPAHPASASEAGAALGLGLIYKSALDVTYSFLLSPDWRYSGLYLSVNPHKVLVSFLLLFPLLLIFRFIPRRPSRYLLMFVAYTGVIPLLSLYGLQDRPSDFLYVVVASFLLSVSLTLMPRLRVITIEVSPYFFLFINLALVIIVVAWVCMKGGLGFLNFDILDIYQYRRTVEAITYLGIFSYLIHWVTNACLVVLLIQSIRYRWWLVLCLAGLSELFFYSTLAIKSPLFTLPFVIYAYYSVRSRNADVRIGMLYVSLLMAGLLEFYIFGTTDLASIVTRRLLFVPSFLAYAYHGLFEHIGYVYWTDSYLGALIRYPFAAPPQILVAQITGGDAETWANNGMFGSGFMQAGFLGMLIYGGLFGGWLYFIDCIAASGVPLAVAVGMLVAVTSMVVDTDILTVLMTHGGGFATLLLWLSAGAKRRGGDLGAPKVSVGAGNL
jgi:hypothetical protein